MRKEAEGWLAGLELSDESVEPRRGSVLRRVERVDRGLDALVVHSRVAVGTRANVVVRNVFRFSIGACRIVAEIAFAIPVRSSIGRAFDAAS